MKPITVIFFILVIVFLLAISGCSSTPVKPEKKSFEQIQIEACTRLGGVPFKAKAKLQYSALPKWEVDCRFVGERVLTIKHRALED